MHYKWLVPTRLSVLLDPSGLNLSGLLGLPGSTDGLLSLQISSGVALQSKDLQQQLMSSNMLYLLSLRQSLLLHSINP